MSHTHVIASLFAGQVIPDIGQVDASDLRNLKALIRRGDVVKWRGKWYPDAGAAYGLGPDKTCYALRDVAEAQQWCNPAITRALEAA